MLTLHIGKHNFQIGKSGMESNFGASTKYMAASLCHNRQLCTKMSLQIHCGKLLFYMSIFHFYQHLSTDKPNLCFTIGA